MPANFGRRPFQTTGYAVRASADGRPEWKIGGITLEPSVLPTNGTGSDLTLTLDQTTVKNGGKYLLLGTVMTRITLTAVDVVTLNNTPTGGTFTITVANSISTQTTAGLAYNATNTTVQTALRGLSNVGGTLATVTGSAGGPYTITFDNSLGAVTVTASGTSLTGGGAQPTATVSSTAPGGDFGSFGPYDSTASDGRQNLNRGDCFILDETWLDTAVPAFPNQGTAHPPVFDGGSVDKAKLVLSTGQGSNALPAGYPAGPTLSAFLTAFPRVSFVND